MKIETLDLDDIEIEQPEFNISSLNVDTADVEKQLKEIELNEQVGGDMELNLDEIDMGTKPNVLDLNLEADEPEVNLANENVKVIKISADSNTLNMINK